MVKPQAQSAQNSSLPINEPITFNAKYGLGFRLYPDNRPANLEIAPLQKGLVLLISGKELIEEGAGFGSPIAKYKDVAYFSRTAQIYLDDQGEDFVFLRKVFFLDAVSRKQLQGASINEDFYSLFHKTFERAYLGRRRLRPIFDWIMRLRKTMGVTTQFPKVTPKGKITVSYHCYPNKIDVTVDLSKLDKTECEQVLILNEQGASVFRRFSDNRATILYDNNIGAWSRVNAEKVSFSDLKEYVSFSLANKNDATMYCGREVIEDRFSWSGITYALSPNTSRFNYAIETRGHSNLV